MESDIPDKPVPREIRALLSDERLIVRETQRAVPPFGGVAVFLSFLGKIDLVDFTRGGRCDLPELPGSFSTSLS